MKDSSSIHHVGVVVNSPTSYISMILIFQPKLNIPSKKFENIYLLNPLNDQKCVLNLLQN